jgi:hypothetical protein
LIDELTKLAPDKDAMKRWSRAKASRWTAQETFLPVDGGSRPKVSA